MMNLLGDLWGNGSPQWDRLLAHPRVRLHLYGKDQAKPGRKMGHFLLLGENPDRILYEAETLLPRVTQKKPVMSGRTTEISTEKKLPIPSDDQKEGEVVELSGPEEHLALSSSLFSADFFLKDMRGFSQPFGEIPS
jgi:hypothetical protein